jgi:hypothetical protein
VPESLSAVLSLSGALREGSFLGRAVVAPVVPAECLRLRWSVLRNSLAPLLV